MKQMKKLLALTMAMLLILALFTGCGGASKEMAADSAAGAPMEEPMAMPETEAYEGEMGFDSMTMDVTTEESAPEPNEDAPESEAAPEQSDLAEKIIYSGYLYVETTEFDQGLAALDAMVTEFGGFLENSDVNGYTITNDDGTTSVVDRHAYYTVRVPCDRFTEFMSRVGTIGNVTQNSKNATNITSQFTDTEAYLESLQLQEDRLLVMMESATDVDTLVTLEARLSEVRYEIESATRQLRNWQQQVDYSTVTVDLQEVAVYTPTVGTTRTFGERVADAFSDGWNSFGNGLERLIVGLISIWPTLLILAAIVVVVVVLVKRHNKKVRARYGRPVPPQTPPAAPQQPPQPKDET